MTRILTFDEWALNLFDFNRNGKLDKASERTAYKKALNNRNITQTRESYAQYVALAEAANKNEREQEQTAALIAAAGAGNETAGTLLTGESKSKTAKTIAIIAAAAAVVVVFLIRRKK